MGNSGSAFNRWDQLFQALTRPEDLRAYLEQMAPLEQGPRQGALRTQIELLTGTLQLEIALLRVSEVAESFDTATFCLGQLVSHEPQMISELPFAHTFVDGLSSALRKGWLVHHGVGKFAANALTILCICEQAVPAVREHAIAELLSGLLEWLRSDDPAADVDEVCGCNCGCPALSATCWLERLLSKPDELLEARVRESPQLWPLVTAMLHVICRRDGNPFALTRLLRIPSVFGDLMRHDEAAASTTLNFLTFGMLQFDNPMFTEDAVQVFLTLLRDDNLREDNLRDDNLRDDNLREDDLGAHHGAASLLARRCSLPLLEALGTAACYLPSAMTALELLCAHPPGRIAVYSLAAALGADAAASPAAGDAPAASAAAAATAGTTSTSGASAPGSDRLAAAAAAGSSSAEGEAAAAAEGTGRGGASSPFSFTGRGASSPLASKATVHGGGSGSSGGSGGGSGSSGSSSSSGRAAAAEAAFAPRNDGGASEGESLLALALGSLTPNTTLTHRPQGSPPVNVNGPQGSPHGQRPADGVVLGATGVGDFPTGDFPTGDSPTGRERRSPARPTVVLLSHVLSLASTLSQRLDSARDSARAAATGAARWLPRRPPRSPSRLAAMLARHLATDEPAAPAGSASASPVGKSSGEGGGAPTTAPAVGGVASSEGSVSRGGRVAASGLDDHAGRELDSDEDDDEDEEDDEDDEDEDGAHGHEHDSAPEHGARDGATSAREAEGGGGRTGGGGDSEGGGVEAWDAFLEELPHVTVVTLAATSSAADSTADVAKDRAATGAGDTATAAVGGGSSSGSSSSSSSSSALASSSSSSSSEATPRWPNARLRADAVKAWVLLELAGFREGQEAALLARMSLPDKRVWLSRRLYRHHHGGKLSEEDPILFVEATRDEPARVLHQVR
jgi:hypothetical protein